MKKSLFAGLLTIVFTVLLSGCGQVSDPTKITMDEFLQLKSGMSYEDVIGTVGSFGTLGSEVGSPGDPTYIEIRHFQGEGKPGANAILQFMNGKLEAKAQSGLE